MAFGVCCSMWRNASFVFFLFFINTSKLGNKWLFLTFWPNIFLTIYRHSFYLFINLYLFNDLILNVCRFTHFMCRRSLDLDFVLTVKKRKIVHQIHLFPLNMLIKNGKCNVRFTHMIVFNKNSLFTLLNSYNSPPKLLHLIGGECFSLPFH